MIAKFFDEFLLAAQGILKAMKYPRFWLVFVLGFLLFGTLMQLLSAGFASFSLMFALGFPACLVVIKDALLGLFGVGVAFSDWLLVFVVTLLQSILIAVIALVSHLKKLQKSSATSSSTSANLERAGLATGLAVLGAGCPTCGTALLTPILGAIFAGGSAIVGTVSIVITIFAIFIIIFSLKKVGEDCYVIIVSNNYHKKKMEEHADRQDD